jgi:hypothetical protein
MYSRVSHNNITNHGRTPLIFLFGTLVNDRPRLVVWIKFLLRTWEFWGPNFGPEAGFPNGVFSDNK